MTPTRRNPRHSGTGAPPLVAFPSRSAGHRWALRTRLNPPVLGTEQRSRMCPQPHPTCASVPIPFPQHLKGQNCQEATGQPP